METPTTPQTPIQNGTPEKKKMESSIPGAIIVAGLLIAVALFAAMHTQGDGSKNQSIASKVGLNDKKMQACINSGETKDAVDADIASGDKAFAHLDPNQRGTPYTVLVGKNGTKVEVQGAAPYEYVKGNIDGILAGTATDNKEIDLDPVTADDHILGSMDADVVIVEYSDFECPFCNRFHPILHQLKNEYGDKIAWVYRNYPLNIHAHAYVKAQAAECAAQIGGNDGFWKYADALFDSLTPEDTFSTSTL